MSDVTKDVPVWRTRPSDPQLEAAMLVRLMSKLGARRKPRAPRWRRRAAGASQPRPRGQRRAAARWSSMSPSIAHGAVSAWRSTAAGSRSKTATARGGLYFVRYVDPKYAGREEPNFFSKLFSSDKGAGNPQRYRIAVKRAGEKTQVAVQSSQGAPENSETGQRIVALLVEELK